MANRIYMAKGLKNICGAFPLMFLGPSIIYNAFMNQQTAWHYLVLVLGIILCLLSVYFLYRGLKLIMKGIFND